VCRQVTQDIQHTSYLFCEPIAKKTTADKTSDKEDKTGVLCKEHIRHVAQRLQNT
jgi:hypothetical protein